MGAAVVMGMNSLPAAPPLPPLTPDLHSPSAYSVAAGLLEAPTTLQGQFKFIPLVGAEGQPGRGWKRRTTSNPRILSAWAVQHPTAALAVRTGVPGGVVVMEITRETGLAPLEDRLGRLPHPTIESISEHGVRRLWFRLSPNCPRCPTAPSLGGGVRLIGDGGYARLPAPGEWRVAPDDPDPAADFRLFPAAWVRHVVTLAAEPVPTVRLF